MLLGFLHFLMTHELDLTSVRLSVPNRNCYLGQTAVLVLIEADISFVCGFHSYTFFQSKVPSLGYCWHSAVLNSHTGISTIFAALPAYAQSRDAAAELLFRRGSFLFMQVLGMSSPPPISCFQAAALSWLLRSGSSLHWCDAASCRCNCV